MYDTTVLDKLYKQFKNTNNSQEKWELAEKISKELRKKYPAKDLKVDADEDIEWITVRGQHVPLQDGKAIGGMFKGKSFTQAEGSSKAPKTSAKEVDAKVDKIINGSTDDFDKKQNELYQMVDDLPPGSQVQLPSRWIGEGEGEVVEKNKLGAWVVKGGVNDGYIINKEEITAGFFEPSEMPGVEERPKVVRVAES